MFPKINVRFLLVIVFIAITGGIIFLVSKSKQGVTPPRHEAQAGKVVANADVALRNAHFSEMLEGKVEWELVADQAVYDKNGETVFLTGIHMDFLQSPSSGKITVTATTGEYLTKTENVKLRGKVHMVASDGVVFDTESIDYNAAQSSFHTDLPVTFCQERLTLDAVGMDMKVRDHIAHFHKSVNATVSGATLAK